MVIYVRTTGGLTRIEDQVLTTASTAARNDLAERQFQQVTSLTSAGPLQKLIARGGSKAASSMLSDLVVDHGFTEAQVVDGKGSLLASVSEFESPVALSYLHPGSSGQPTFDFQNYLGEVLLVTAQPMTVASSKAVTLVCARQLDDSTLAAVAGRTGSQLSLYTGPVPAVSGNQASRIGFGLVASSLPPDRRVDALFLGAGSHSSAAGWTTEATTLDDAGGRPIAVATVGVPDVAFASIRSSMGGALLLALLLALAAAVVATALISQVVMRPVLDLCRAAKAIAAGEHAQRLEVRGNDEVAEASRAFNNMSRQVALTMEDLSDQIQGLSRELADLSLVGEALSQSADVKAALMPVASRVREMTDSDFCGLHLLEGELMAPGLYSGHLHGSVQPIEELACWIVAHCEAIMTDDLPSDPRVHTVAQETGIASLMAVPITYRGHALGAVTVGSRASKSYGPDTAAILSTVASQTATALANAETYKELEHSYLQTVTALAAALEAKDHYTADHAESLAEMACAVGHALGLSDGRLRQLQYAAVLHDVGKIAIPLTVLEKPGPLTDDEFRLMREHTVIGERIVSRIDYLRPLAGIIRSAHERWDGRGYPDGLADHSIPLEARIIFVCDAYHAMTSDRPYRKALSLAAARAELLAGSGSQFDPTVVEAFLAACCEPCAAQAPVADLAASVTATTATRP